MSDKFINNEQYKGWDIYSASLGKTKIYHPGKGKHGPKEFNTINDAKDWIDDNKVQNSFQNGVNRATSELQGKFANAGISFQRGDVFKIPKKEALDVGAKNPGDTFYFQGKRVNITHKGFEGDMVWVEHA